MEEQDIREAKRARNFIWTTAENYELEPLYLAFSPDGRADMYLNMIIGLSSRLANLFSYCNSSSYR